MAELNLKLLTRITGRASIYGDSLGFFQRVSRDYLKKYSGQKAGQIAQYNLGISFINNREYENAIIALNKVSFNDEIC